MNWRINIAVLMLLVLASCGQKTVIEDSNSPYLIETADLVSMMDDSNTVVLDFRKVEDYNKGHIPQAIQIWRTDLEDTSYNYGGMMPQQKQLEALFSNLGIRNGDRIVLYDDIGLCDAARLWWVLQNYNYTQVKMLNGGLRSWVEAGNQLSKTSATPAKTAFSFNSAPSYSLRATKEDVVKAIKQNVKLLDTRSKEEYEGTYQKKGAAKAGSIPTSVQIDWAEAINYNGDRRFKSKEELEAIYSRLEIDKDDPVIVYCHSGVRSAHTTFVLTQLLGYSNVTNYDGSWVEWSHDDSLLTESLTLTNNTYE
jgi:thiosulfate/3-mercaptopyruvate sulfurtransferase